MNSSAPLFQTNPGPLVGHTTWDRVEGMMLGVAIGDALGNTTETMIPRDRKRYFSLVLSWPLGR